MIRAGAALALIAVAVPSSSAVTQDWSAELREQMHRMATVGYRLSLTAEPTCAVKAAKTGLLVDDAAAYNARDRPRVARLLGLADLPQVASVVPDSPASAAGILAGDDIFAINGRTTSELKSALIAPDLIADEIENKLASTPSGASLQLDLRRRSKRILVNFLPVEGCGAKFVIKTGRGMEAFSDAQNVGLSAKLIAFTQSDDELAMVAGHELAHIIYGDATSKDHVMQRDKEDRADLLGASLARCAGYDLRRALGFWPRYDKQDWLRFFRDSSHRSVKRRVALIEAYSLSGPCPPMLAPKPKV